MEQGKPRGAAAAASMGASSPLLLSQLQLPPPTPTSPHPLSLRASVAAFLGVPSLPLSSQEAEKAGKAPLAAELIPKPTRNRSTPAKTGTFPPLTLLF